jgi:hypothetical protein
VILLLATGAVNAQIKPEPINAMHNPSRHAWELFMMVNHPAKDPRLERGVPDLSKKLGDDGLTVWETWKLARSEVFLEDGSRPPPWEDLSLDDTINNEGRVAKRFELPKPLVLQAVKAGIDPRQALRGRIGTFADVGDGVFGIGGGETRMNRPTFEFIVNNELFNIEGQEALYEEVAAGRKPALSFPVDSMEVKAMWTPLSPEEEADGRSKRFHISLGQDGRKYRLVALHIITKDVPKWFWTTFRQVDGPKPQIPSLDTYGQPPALKGTKWEYYELSGTQTDFTDEMGRPTFLSDPHIEAGFENSSCISCHALATIGRRDTTAPSGGPNQIAFFNTTGGPTGAPIGTPNPNWFFEPMRFRSSNPPHQDYIQLDFLFSMPFRANRKKN